MKFSLFYYLVSSAPAQTKVDPFGPFGHWTPWQKFCRKILFTPLYKQRYLDHLQLSGYKGQVEFLKKEELRYIKKIDRLLEINANNESNSYLEERNAYYKILTELLEAKDYKKFLDTLPPGTLISKRRYAQRNFTIYSDISDKETNE